MIDRYGKKTNFLISCIKFLSSFCFRLLVQQNLPQKSLTSCNNNLMRKCHRDWKRRLETDYSALEFQVRSTVHLVCLKIPNINFNTSRVTVVTIVAIPGVVFFFQVLSEPQLEFLALVEKLWVSKIVKHQKRWVRPESRQRVPHWHRLVPNEFFPRKKDLFACCSDEGAQGSGTDIRVTRWAAPFAIKWSAWMCWMAVGALARNLSSNVHKFEGGYKTFLVDVELARFISFGVEADSVTGVCHIGHSMPLACFLWTHHLHSFSQEGCFFLQQFLQLILLFTGEFCARTTLRSLSRGLIRKHINGEQNSDKTLHAERLQRKRKSLETVEVDPQFLVSVLTEKRA